MCTRHHAGEDGVQTVTEAVCTETGLLANPYCPDAELRSFPKDDVPGACTAHGQSEAGGTVTVTVCSQTGLAATEFCPQTKQAAVARDAVPGACTVHTGP